LSDNFANVLPAENNSAAASQTNIPESNKLMVTPSPHVKSKVSTSDIMLDVLVALVPTLAAATYIFGIKALLLSVVCVVSCVAFEYIFRRILKLSNTISDLSAAVTGLLLAFNLPVGMPYWMAVIGSFVAIVIVKQLFGGIGQNFVNPAIAARIVLFVSFAKQMTTYVIPYNFGNGIQLVAGATPLRLLSGDTAQLPPITSMLFGFRGGCLGETCVVGLVLGGAYLVYKKVISPIIPLSFMGTVFVLTWLLGANPVYHLLSGGLVLGAIFMATDYTTSPTTDKGKYIYGIGCGLITVLIRLYGSYPEGVSFAIILMNIVTPHIDTLTRLKPFGVGGAKK